MQLVSSDVVCHCIQSSDFVLLFLNINLLFIDIPSHLDDLPPTMLKKDYANVPVINRYAPGKGSDGSLQRLVSYIHTVISGCSGSLVCNQHQNGKVPLRVRFAKAATDEGCEGA